MIKQAIKTLMMGGAMMVLPLMFTSCEDILGHWEKPTPAEPSVEEMLTNLSSALEEGALVTITYTVDGVTYTSTFKKVGDEYVEQSTTSAARALTRASTSIQALLYYLGADNSYNFRAIEGEKIVLNTQIDVATATTTTTFSSNGAAFGGMTVNGKPVLALSGSTKWINVILKSSGTNMGAVGCKEGDTWDTFYQRLSKNGYMIIQIIDGVVSYSNGGITGQLYYKNDDSYIPVLPDDQILGDVYAEVETITYQEARWDETSVVYKDPAPSTSQFTLVSPSEGSVTWSGGTYVVKDNVTIAGDLDLKGDVNLILCDGATLTVNGRIYGDGDYSLTIYVKSQGDTAGKLEVNEGLNSLSYLTIHGGNITVNEGGSICFTPITVYGGKLSISAAVNAIKTNGDGMTVYGGEVNAINNDLEGIYLGDGDGTLTVYGGKVNAAGNPAIFGYFKAGEGTGIGFFGCDDNVSWTTITNTPTTATTSGYKYFHAGVEAPIPPID